MPMPADPIAAVVHRNPYPYYRRLATAHPLHREPTLGLWVAASAGAVEAALASPHLRVRPPGQPVPSALAGTAAGALFRRLARMNDGARHVARREAAVAQLHRIPPAAVADAARRCQAALPEGDVAAAMHRLPAQTVAALLGLPDEAGADAARLTADLAVGFAPMAGAAEAATATAAAARLLVLLDDGGPADRTANRVGLLTQAFDATAGLIGNALLALSRMPGLAARLAAEPGRWPDFLAEVLRWDPPVQNTRRFVAADVEIAGRRLRAGDAVLVVLAAANRDPAANADPEAFRLDRPDRRHYTFGAGPHACPGAAVAVGIAAVAVPALAAAVGDLGRLVAGVRYRASANARVPVFANVEEPAA